MSDWEPETSFDRQKQLADAHLERLPPICKSYRTYKGTRPPKCCGGMGCKVCWLIYQSKRR